MGARLEGNMGRLSGIPAVIIANLVEMERDLEFRFRIRSLWTHDQSEQFLFQFHWCQNVSDLSRI